MLELSENTILQAYRLGIFPMARDKDSETVDWYCPDHRGILPLDDRFQVASRLARTVRQGKYRVTINQDFAGVIAASADTREKSWINPAIQAVYTGLHRMGHAHSVECWDENDALVGGLYGVALGAAFCGEAMFSTARDASKVALVHLVQHLRARGFMLSDTQFVTDHLAQFGAYEVARDDYLALLAAAIDKDAQF